MSKKRVSLLLPLLLFFFPSIVDAGSISKPLNNLGLVGYWSFNEGTTTTAGDFSGYGSTGTLQSSPSWVAGKRGGALNFTGANWVDTADRNEFSPIVNDVTISIWARVPTSASAAGSGAAGGSGRYLITKGAAGQYEWGLENDSNTQFCFSAWTSGGAVHGDLCASRTMNDGGWHHYVVTVDYGVAITAYVDGIAVGEDTSFGSAMSNGTQDVEIGRRGDGNYFIGDLDEARIYSRALTATEVAAMYTAGSARINTLGTAVTSGLVYRWSFDGINVAEKITDPVGGNHGYYFNNSTSSQYILGKIGSAFMFDGTNDFIRAESVTMVKNSFSASAWVKTTSTGDQKIISTGTLHQLQMFTGGVLRICVNGCSAGTTAINDGVWHLLTVVGDTTSIRAYIDGSSTAEITQSTQATSMSGALAIGAVGGASPSLYFNGSIDDVRIYNRGLTTAEIKKIYQEGVGTKVNVTTVNDSSLDKGLIGYWSFNGADMTDKVYDRIGGYNGYVYVQATTSAKTLGKIGQALRLNSTGYVVTGYTIPAQSSATSFTWSTWLKLDTGNPSNAVILGFRTGASFIKLTPTRFEYGAGSVMSYTIPTTGWVHVTIVKSGSAFTYYANGAVATTGSSSASPISNTFYIGHDPGLPSDGFVRGVVDEVRVYDRALTAAEVYQLYNAGR